jgi:phosphopantothenoylcysteine decarboxylase / phosphopantothenate---cysteine ligase
LLIMSAAVADFTPSTVLKNKIKKSQKFDSVKLKETNDILASLKKGKQKIVGFALESTNGLANAQKKLTEKNLNMIVLNTISKKGSGFEYDTNKVTIIKKKGKPVSIPLMTKFQVANKILFEIKTLSD